MSGFHYCLEGPGLLFELFGFLFVVSSLSTLSVIRSIISIMKLISDTSVSCFMISLIEAISLLTCYSRSSQYSRRILVNANPKLSCASSHLSCNTELITGTCGVMLTRSDLGIVFVCTHFERYLMWCLVLVS